MASRYQSKRTRPSISVSAKTFTIVKAVCEQHGITHGELVEALLDKVSPSFAVRQSVPNAAMEKSRLCNGDRMPGAWWCAICERDEGPFFATTIDGVTRAACQACRGEHPRSGRYSFNGGKPDARGVTAGTSLVGQGNRHRSGKGNRA